MHTCIKLHTIFNRLRQIYYNAKWTVLVKILTLDSHFIPQLVIQANSTSVTAPIIRTSFSKVFVISTPYVWKNNSKATKLIAAEKSITNINPCLNQKIKQREKEQKGVWFKGEKNY
jgi:hypothetical protein